MHQFDFRRKPTVNVLLLLLTPETSSFTLITDVSFRGTPLEPHPKDVSICLWREAQSNAHLLIGAIGRRAHNVKYSDILPLDELLSISVTLSPQHRLLKPSIGHYTDWLLNQVSVLYPPPSPFHSCLVLFCCAFTRLQAGPHILD